MVLENAVSSDVVRRSEADGDLVSAVIPTRGRPEFVVKAVASALGQSYRLLEVIVVIDGEDRATEVILAEVDDERLRLIPLATNVGAAEARNVGVRAARGEWVAFLDDDDEWLPQKIEMQIEAARKSEGLYPVVSSRLIVRTPAKDFVAPEDVYEHGRPISEFLFCRRRFSDGACGMQTSTLFVKRDLLLAVPFRAGLKRHQDWDWLLRAWEQPGVRFHMLDAALAIFRVEDDRESVSRSTDWEFSACWGRAMLPGLTPKAYSFFVATECMSRAVKSKAGARVYLRILRDFLRGRPTVRSVGWLAAFVFLPRGVRVRVRELLRRERRVKRERSLRMREICRE